MTIGTGSLPFGSTNLPASLTPPRPSNPVSVTSNVMRRAFLPSNSISPVAQRVKDTLCPSGRSVHPSVLVHEPSCFLCKTPVVPSNLRQRKVLPSDCAISTISPSEKRYVPIWQLSPAFSPERAAPIQAADKLQRINSSNNERILKQGILVFDAIRHCFGFKFFLQCSSPFAPTSVPACYCCVIKLFRL